MSNIIQTELSSLPKSRVKQGVSARKDDYVIQANINSLNGQRVANPQAAGAAIASGIFGAFMGGAVGKMINNMKKNYVVYEAQITFTMTKPQLSTYLRSNLDLATELTNPELKSQLISAAALAISVGTCFDAQSNPLF